MIDKRNSPGGDPTRKEVSPAENPKVYESRDLLGDGDQALIRHEGRLYCLRRTRLGKLILTA